jgi:hypothetical protein
MKPLTILAAVAFICPGCTWTKVERIVNVHDTIRAHTVTDKALIFTHVRESWYPGADVPLFGPAVETVEADLWPTGQARIHLKRVKWWARLQIDNTSRGIAGATITPSDIRDGGAFRLYRPPPTPGDTNIFPSEFLLTIQKP